MIREGDPLALDQGYPSGADRAAERQAGQLRRRRRGIDGHDVVEVIGVERHDRDDDLHLVAQALDERRAKRPVDQPAGEDRVLAGPALTAEERAGNAPGGVHALLDVDGQREEVELLLRRLPGRRGREKHRVVVEVGDDGTGGLTGEPAGLEPDGVRAVLAVVDRGNGFVYCVFVGLRHGVPLSYAGKHHACRISAGGACDVRAVHLSGAGLRSKRLGLHVPGHHYRGPASWCGNRVAAAPCAYRRWLFGYCETGSDPVGPLPATGYRRRPSRSMIDRYRLISVLCR